MGRGHLYQGTYKSFPVQDDEHLYAVCRYAERNALRANLVERAEEWRWCSLAQRVGRQRLEETVRLCDWPIPRPRNWVGLVNAVQTEGELDALRRSVRRGCPFGDEVWQQSTAKQLGLEFTLRPEGDRERNNERPREPTKWDLSPFRSQFGATRPRAGERLAVKPGLGNGKGACCVGRRGLSPCHAMSRTSAPHRISGILLISWACDDLTVRRQLGSDWRDYPCFPPQPRSP